MRSRAQTIAIILSKFKKRFGTSFSAVTQKRETKAQAMQRARDAQDAGIRERRRAQEAGEMPAGSTPSHASNDLIRVQKTVPGAMLVSDIAGASVIYPDGSILRLPYVHDQFIDQSKYGGEIGALHKTFEAHKAIQARLWDSHDDGQLAITIHTPMITQAQARVILDASKYATDTLWDQVPTEGFNTRTLGISGGSPRTADVAKALSTIVDTQQSMSFASQTKKKSLRATINKLKAQGHRASDYVTKYHGTTIENADSIIKNGFDPEQSRGARESWFGSRRVASGHTNFGKGALLKLRIPKSAFKPEDKDNAGLKALNTQISKWSGERYEPTNVNDPKRFISKSLRTRSRIKSTKATRIRRVA